ncbi:MAG: DUF2019 domain-containing protein [Afipia sp.]|jgi:hypothetical protein|nr:DUF2019 domain-containing protein [Afipia sp.]
MKKVDLSVASIDELLDRIVDFSIEQGKANDVFAVARSNRIGDSIYEIIAEIKRRSNGGGAPLMKLFTHENAQVRFNAATAVSGTFTSQARDVLKQISESSDVRAFDARMYLHTLEEWIRKKEQSRI